MTCGDAIWRIAKVLFVLMFCIVILSLFNYFFIHV